MTKKVNSKKDLPKSFDLGKYDCLENLSDKDLFRQLYWRQDDLTMKHSEMPEYGLCLVLNTRCIIITGIHLES